MIRPRWRGAGAAIRTAALALAMLALLAGSAPASARERGAATPDPSADTSVVGSPHGGLVPDELGGFPTQITLTRGREHLEDLDAEDPGDAATLAELTALLAATGRPVEDLTTALAYVSTEELFAFVVALRIAGAPDGTILPTYVPLLLDDLAVTRQGSTELAGREALVVYSDAGAGEVALYVLEEGDTVWLLQGPEQVVIEAIEDVSTD